MVLDEADSMSDLGFGPRVVRMIDSVQLSRRALMFSAAFPRRVEALAEIEMTIGGRLMVCQW